MRLSEAPNGACGSRERRNGLETKLAKLSYFSKELTCYSTDTMAGNFHEQFEDAVERPSDRSTGLVFAAVSVIVAAVYYRHMPVLVGGLILAALFGGLSLLAPDLLRPLNIMWFNFGRLLQKVVRPAVMGVLFMLVIVPFGLVMRLRYDPLQAKIGPNHKSFWIERSPVGQGAPSMKNQF
jgi:hypothetical protein